MDTQRFVTNLAREAEENPTMALAAAAAFLTAAAKFVNASAWRREVARRALKDRRN